jgi:peptide-methionine (S)-S-oxide reductase
MKRLISTFFSIVFFVSCAQTQNNKIPAGNKKAKPGEAVAYFAQGCFWHTEIIFQSLEGVRDAVSGFAGGTTINPSYEEVCTGQTGHAETVQVSYDPAKISYATLVDAFFASQDPTTLNRQGNDIGTEYRSIAFYQNKNEKNIIEAAIRKLDASKKYKNKVVTEVMSFKTFYPAEDYHQEYISRNPSNSYVQNVSIPDYKKFRKEFKGKFKD